VKWGILRGSEETRPVLFLSLLACDGGAADEIEATIDTRVDHAGKDDVWEATGPRMCTSGSQVYVVWQEARDGAASVWLNASRDGGASWFPSDVRVNHGEAAATTPSVACDGETVWVVWEDARDGELSNRNIYTSSSEDGGITWPDEDVALDLDPDGLHMSLGPNVIAAGGSVYVAWFDSPDGAYDIYLQASTDGGRTWRDGPARVESDGAGAAYSAWPHLVADGEGTVVVVWEDSRNGATDIYANVSRDHGDEWAEDIRLDEGDEPGSANSFSPALARDGDDVYVAWQDERSGSSRDVLLVHSVDGGGSWTEPVRADSDAEGMFDSINVDLAASGGRLQVVWQDDRAGGYDIFHRVFQDGDWKWGELRLDTDIAGGAQSYLPRLAVDGDDVLVVWQDYRQDSGNVGFDDLHYNYSRDRGNRWSAQDRRVNSNEPGSSYAVDANAAIIDGNYAVAWADGRFGSGDIFFATRPLETGSTWLPPEEEEE